jgi:PAS domain S-box-containing protein
VARQRDEALWVEHTHTTINRLESLFALVADAQDSYRGYLLTGDERVLQPYLEALQAAPRASQEMATLVRDNPEQVRRAAALSLLVTRLLDHGRVVVQARRTQSLSDLLRQLTPGPGRALHDELHGRILEMEGVERQLLRTRETAASRAATATHAVILGGLAFACAVVFLAIALIRRDFVGRQRAEAELERFFTLSLDFLCISSVDGYFKRVSPAVTDILGWSVAEFLGTPYLDLVHPEDRDATWQQVERQTLTGEKVLHFANRYRHKDGSWRVLSWRSTPQPGGLMYATARDITEVRRAEAALIAAHDQLELRVKERTAELLETTRSLEVEAIERRDTQRKLQSQLQHMSLLEQITRSIGERQDSRSIYGVVASTIEEQMPVEFSVVCSYDSARSELTVECIGSGGAALAEQLRLSHHARLEIDGNGLSRCVGGRLAYEPDVTLVQFPFPQRLAGVGLRAFVAAPISVEGQVFGVLLACRRQPESFSSDDCDFLRQLSEHVALAANQAQLYGALESAYEDLRQTQQAVLQQERLRALGQMASGIAHDINNALGPVALYTESLLEGERNLSPRGRGYLKTIERAVDDVAKTVERMREFYRERDPQVSFAPVDVNLLVQQVLDLTRARWSDMAHQRGVTIAMKTQLATALPPASCAQSEIREALINLIFNALDAMPAGGALTISTFAQEREPAHARHERRVTITITDTGVGMSEDTRRRCLEPFFTTKGERGTGLGLAMVYGIAQRHGADFEIDSVLGSGTTVRLTLPVAAQSPRELSPALLEPERPPPLRILVVDDDPTLRQSLRDILESDGHRLAVAPGGREGIEAFAAAHGSHKPFDVVITDLGMPEVDGLKVATAVKTRAPSLPVILLTGWGQRLIEEEGTPPNVDRVLAKPPKIRELRAALVAVLAQGTRV